MSQSPSHHTLQSVPESAGSVRGSGDPDAASPDANGPLTYVFTGGGSGGHVNPALAIADEIRDAYPTSRIEYIGVRGKIEAELVPERGYPIHLVRASGLPANRRILPLARFGFTTVVGVMQCLVLLLRLRPNVVVATGGYASSPVLFALSILRRLRLTSASCFIHEQNVVPGLVNRLASRIADRIGVSFRETARFFPPSKVVHVGYPVRREITEISRMDARQKLGIPDESRMVFAFGGSQGARSINRGLVGALPELLSNPDVIVYHVLGIQDSPEYNAETDTSASLNSVELPDGARDRYHTMRYAHDIQIYYAASDVIIGRAGAGTVTEICAGGHPSVLVPLPNAPGDHQALNARTLEDGGASVVLYEEAERVDGELVSTVNSDRLARLIRRIVESPDQMSRMGHKARTLFDDMGLDRIMQQLTFPTLQTSEHLSDESSSPNGSYEGPGSDHSTSTEAISQLSPNKLLRNVESANLEALESIGISYLKYKTDGYLTNPNWQIRNVGVKLAGHLDYEDKIPLLLAMLIDRTPASWLQRIFGGDFIQVGFIRRNILRSLIQIDRFTPEIRDALIASFSDPYYEARSAAADAAGVLAARGEMDKQLNEALLKLAEDTSFEVSVAAIRALGKVGDGDVLPALHVYYLHPNWKIREAILRACTDLVKRGRLADTSTLRTDMSQMLITCVDFKPTFPIKQAMNELVELIKQQESGN